MRKVLFAFICAFLMSLFVCVFVFMPKVEKKQVQIDTTIPEIDSFLAINDAPIKFYDVKTTAELRNLLSNYDVKETPRIYVQNFPSDFSTEGDLDLFVRVLLPHILRQNEIQTAERNAFLKLSDKINAGVRFTQKEANFFQKLVIKYESLDPNLVSQANTLFHRIDRMSPSLAIAQSLKATENMKTNLKAPFDVFRWDENKQYSRVLYSDLARAVEDYALELNRGLSYNMYHMQRSIYRDTRYELPGSVFTDGLKLYKLDEKGYADKVYQVIKDNNLYDLDFATFKK